MDNLNNEQNRITLSIAFIATYLTIIIGFADKIRPDSLELKITNDIVFTIFIVFGIFISLLFFLYLAFTALGLSTKRKKHVMLEQEISQERIEEMKQHFFNWGIYWIFVSFSYPVYYLLNIFQKAYSFWVAMALWFVCDLLILILLQILFRDKKNK